jgi:hypothetical protein
VDGRLLTFVGFLPFLLLLGGSVRRGAPPPGH